MRAQIFRPALIVPLIWLGACASAPQETAPPVAAIRTPENDAAKRRTEIARQLAKICPGVLTPGELDRYAGVVDRLAQDRDAVAMAGRLFRFDSEARVCRGLPVAGAAHG